MSSSASPPAKEQRKRFVAERGASWDAVHRYYFPDYDLRWTMAIAGLREMLPAQAKVLDLGCGPRTLTARLGAELNAESVVGVDIDPLLTELAQAAFAEKSVQFRCGDVLRPETTEQLRSLGPFDAVISSALMHYFAPSMLAQVLDNCASLVRLDGVLMTVERFAASDIRSTAAEEPLGLSPWQKWWDHTRDEAPRYGFTASPQDSVSSQDEPPPLTLPAYLTALATSGFVVESVSACPAESRIVVARPQRYGERLR